MLPRSDFAYVSFVNPIHAMSAAAAYQHHINGQDVVVRAAYSWNQSEDDIRPLLKRPPNREMPRTDLIDFMEELCSVVSEDVVAERILSKLNILELDYMAEYECINEVFKSMRKLSIEHDDPKKTYTLMDIRRILRLYAWGDTLHHLTIDGTVLSANASTHLCDRLVEYVGEQLKSLTLRHLAITTKQFAQVKPLLLTLRSLDITIAAGFNYSVLDGIWANMNSLCIRTSGYFQLPLRAAADRSFPSLKKLSIITGYHLHPDLFESLAVSCPNLEDLMVVHFEDMYSKIHRRLTSPPNFEPLQRFTQLKKLHLSTSAKILNVAALDKILNVHRMVDLTLELTSLAIRSLWPDGNILRNIGERMPMLRHLCLSNIPITDDELFEIIVGAPSLIHYRLNRCGSQKMNAELIERIVDMRRNLAEDFGKLEIKTNPTSLPRLHNVSVTIYERCSQRPIGRLELLL